MINRDDRERLKPTPEEPARRASRAGQSQPLTSLSASLYVNYQVERQGSRSAQKKRHFDKTRA